MGTNTKGKEKNGSLELAFDVGHSSLGWAVLDAEKPEILGCGAVIFPADDCLASQRRGFRRQRRHIRSTRLRIWRMKRLLEHIGVMTRADLDKPGCAWPWLLAARVLRGGNLLTWPELWDVLRWYAHNRGYDGNRAWSGVEDAQAAKEDIEKVNNARALYEKYGTHSMAETFCAVCGIDPLGCKKSCNLAGNRRPKAMNAAFPRQDVEQEVRTILNKHQGSLSGIDQKLINSLMKDANTIPCDHLRLPLRYRGGLLFGQLVPRFENRIIATCPIMFERVYQRVLKESGDSRKAANEAEKLAKVPTKECFEFYAYRWAMQLANIQVVSDGVLQPLIKNELWRKAIDGQMRNRGYFTASELKNAVRELTGNARNNLDQLLLLPDAGDALVLDPLKKMIAADEFREAAWPLLPERNRKRAEGRLRKGKHLALSEILSELTVEERAPVEAVIDETLKSVNARKRKDKVTREHVLADRMQLNLLTGRAPYHRAIMLEAVADVIERGIHPSEERGCLYRSEAIRNVQLQRAIDQQTNNHLVRHRLLILQRLHKDVLKEYAGGDPARVSRITIEVNRDLREMSGKTAKQVARDMGLRLANFKHVKAKLEEAFKGKGVRITAGLLRKARIAEDLNWTCPYTGKEYDAWQLLSGAVDKDHIIPRSKRPSDSLDSLVITFKEVNAMKGQRSALQFVEDEQAKKVQDAEHLSIKTRQRFLADVESLKPPRDPRKDPYYKRTNKPMDDALRMWRRKQLLKLKEYVDKEFLPRDLTQTSQLVRLGAQALQNAYLGMENTPVISSVPGSVTGAVRKSWDLLGCLSAANPQVLDEDGKIRTKTEIRDITHLHHALDACTLLLASHFLPSDGGVWQLLVKRRLSAAEQNTIRARLGSLVQINNDGEFKLADLPAALKENVRQRLAERRVIQHIPSDMGGLSCDETVYRVFNPSDKSPAARRILRWFEKLLAAGELRKLTKLPVPDDPLEKSVLLVARKRRNEAGGMSGNTLHDTGKEWRWIYLLAAKNAVHGLEPRLGSKGKLAALKAVKLLGDNFGVVQISSVQEKPEFKIIRPRMIWHFLRQVRKENPQALISLIRKGAVVDLQERDSSKTRLRIFGCGERPGRGIYFDAGAPDAIVREREIQISAFADGRARVVESSLVGT